MTGARRGPDKNGARGRRFSWLVDAEQLAEHRLQGGRQLHRPLRRAVDIDMNEMALRRRGIGAPHSKHYEGQAIDLRVRGVPIGKVRDYVWTKYPEAGVGHYLEQNFLHVDYRPLHERIAWTQRNENSTNHYNPTWAKNAAPQGADAVLQLLADEHREILDEAMIHLRRGTKPTHARHVDRHAALHDLGHRAFDRNAQLRRLLELGAGLRATAHLRAQH